MALWKEWLAVGAGETSMAHRNDDRRMNRLFCGDIWLHQSRIFDDM
jgi:hypothetical protein